MKTGRSTFKELLSYLRGYELKLLFSIVCAFLSVVATLYMPVLTGKAIDLIIAEHNVDLSGVAHILLRTGILILLTSLFQWFMGLCNNKITYAVLKDIRTKAFKKLQSLPLSYIDSHPHGDIVSRVISDSESISEGLLLGFTQLFTGVLTIVCSLLFMVFLSYKIAFIVVLITPLSLFVAGFIGKHTYSMFSAQSKAKGELTSLSNEMIENKKIVSAFNYSETASNRFDEINERMSKASLKATFYSSLTNPTTRFVNSIVTTSVVLAGAYAVLNGRLSIGQLSCFISYSNHYTKPFNEISGVITEFQNSLASAARIFEVINEYSEPADAQDAEALDLGDITENTDEQLIRFDKITFAYSDDKPLITGLDLSVRSGQRVAIVGPTGCGKTTLINLIMRFYDVTGGRILIDGKDLRSYSRRTLRENIGMVLQDTWLRSGTIRENIAFGNPDATDEEIILAAKAAHAHSFIKRLPNGYDTYIGEDGGNLSQGQKQLLCIARVMLKLPPVLILDEATSSIDTRTEIQIQKAFSKMMEGRTSFIVAHRLSTIKNADIILVMKDGDIIEQGAHEELLAKGGFYASLYNSQYNHKI